MNMNPRERLLALTIGSVVTFFVLWYGWSTISGMYSFRRNAITALDLEITKLRQVKRQTDAAAVRMRDYEDKSLPPTPSIARSAYQTWLLDQFEKAGFIDPQVTVKNGKEERGLFVTHVYDVTSKGKLPQAVQLLHNFYSADYLHRISKLSLRPIKDSKDLDISVQVEAVSLEKAPAATALTPRPSTRLSLPKQEDYVAIISERNLFGPPNHKPQLSGLGSQTAYRGEGVDIAARGSDSDKQDKLKYTLVKSAAPDARLDPTTGKLSWTPRTNGKYEFLIRATDDGIPARSSPDEKLVVTVEDRPPPAPEPPKKLAFDDAKFTVLSGVIDISGTGQVWLYIRPRGQTLKLGVGDKFEVGSVKGVVTSINTGEFTFEAGGKEHKLTKGGILEQATTIEQ